MPYLKNPGALIYYTLFKEFRCPKPASPDTSPTNGNDSWGDMDLYHCDPGYSFPDGEIDKLFWCTRDGTWEPQGLTCVRKYKIACRHVNTSSKAISA